MRRLSCALALVAVLAPSLARADDARCISAFERTQRLRQSGKLRSARTEALVCSGAECPSVAARDCASWVIELDRLIPSVVFAATSGATELVDVTVQVDGETWASRLDGRALPIDPGPHRIRFTAQGYAAAEQDVLIAEGEKTRKLTASLVATKTAPPAAAPRPSAPAPAPSADAAPTRPVPASVWLLGGASIVALGAGAFFVADGFGKKADLDDSGCKPSCEGGDVDAMKRSLLLGDVLIGTSLVAAAAATILFVSRPTQGATTAFDPTAPLRLRF